MSDKAGFTAHKLLPVVLVHVEIITGIAFPKSTKKFMHNNFIVHFLFGFDLY